MTTSTKTRYALVTITEQPGARYYVHALQPYTMPSATDDIAKARTWASVRGAMQAAARHGLTNVEAVAVTR